MEFVVIQEHRIVEIRHHVTDEVLTWSIMSYDKTRFKSVENPFREINRFIAHQGPDFKDDLFNAYKAIRTTLHNVNEPRALRQRLTDEVAALYNIATLKMISNWSAHHLQAVMPDPSIFESIDPDHPEAGTYGRQDYYQLLLLAVALEMMIPIWGDYIERIQMNAGTALKELEAFKLLGKCDEILYSEAMNKLDRYVRNYLENAPKPASANLAGLTTERLPEWLLASVVVRRLAIGEVDASGDRIHLVSNIHTSMNGMMKDLDRKFGGSFKALNVEEETKRDESNTTIADLAPARQDLTAGQMMTYQTAIMNYRELAELIAPGIDQKKLDQCVQASVDRQQLTRGLFQETICQYVTHGHIAAQVIPRLDPYEFLVLSGTCQAILWHWEHLNLAIYLTVTGKPLASESAQPIEPRSRLPGKIVDRLVELYPYTQPAWSAPPNGAPDRKNNVAVKAAREVAKSLSEYSLYQAECPDDLWAQSPQYSTSRRVVISHDIVESIAVLLIQIAEQENE